MSNIYFKPWKGKNYWNGGCFGKRILVLGESHYGSNGWPSMTQDVLLGHVYKNSKATFTNFEEALYGDYTNNNDRKRIWNSVAFYNYVQECLPKTRQSPTYEQFADSEDAFFEVLEYLEPDVVLVWGRRLWNNLPCTNYTSYDDGEYNGYCYGRGYYSLDSGEDVDICEMQHPSSGFSWYWWHSYLLANDIL